MINDAEERALFRELHGDISEDRRMEIKTRLYEENHKLIYTVYKSHGYTQFNLEYPEVEQVGTIGLWQAIDAFDSGRQTKEGELVKFSTIACWYILAEISKLVQQEMYTLTAPKRQKARAKKIHKIIPLLIQKLSKDADNITAEEIHAELPDIPVNEINSLLFMTNVSSLDTTIKNAEGEETAVVELTPDEGAEEFTQEILNEVVGNSLWDTLKSIVTEKEYEVVFRMFQENKTASEVARDMNVSRQASNAAFNNAMKKIRANTEIFEQFKILLEG